MEGCPSGPLKKRAETKERAFRIDPRQASIAASECAHGWNLCGMLQRAVQSPAPDRGSPWHERRTPLAQPTHKLLTALTLVGSVLDSRAYPDRPCSRSPLAVEGYFNAQHICRA